ncbi:MAG: hypothetical protein AABZ53_06055 [Planctomycetota bacterium]
MSTDPNPPPQSRGSRYGYSAKVRLWVEIGGQRLSLGQVGPDRLYFDEPKSLLAQRATLVIEVDGEADRYEIKILGETAAASSTDVRYEKSAS